MNNSTANRRLPLGLFPGQPIPRLYDRMVEVLRTRHCSRRSANAVVRANRSVMPARPRLSVRPSYGSRGRDYCLQNELIA